MASQGPLWAGAWGDIPYDPAYPNPWQDPYGGGTPIGPPDSGGVLCGTQSDFLQTYNYGFSIPSGQIINGVVANVICKSQGGSANQQSANLLLLPGNPAGGQNKANPALTIPYQSYGTVPFGSPTDTWGLTLDAAAVNSPNFGFQWSCLGGFYGRSQSATQSYVDAVSMTVYYSAAAPPPSTRNRIMV